MDVKLNGSNYRDWAFSLRMLLRSVGFYPISLIIHQSLQLLMIKKSKLGSLMTIV